MIIGEDRVGDALVMTIQGRLNAETADQLQTRLSATLDRGETALIVELSNLDYISSAGMRVLLVAAKRLADDGHFAVCGLNKNIADIFRISGFDTIIDVYADVAEAVAKLES